MCIFLNDPLKYQIIEFVGLNHLGCNEEEAYKLLKSWAELEAFSGKTAKVVKWDFWKKNFNPDIEGCICSFVRFPNSNFSEQKSNKTLLALDDMIHKPKKI